jgi:hypothetical protein
MGWSYVSQRITEALNKVDQNPTQVKKLLATLIVEDPRFLIELTKPHIDGILSHAINRCLHEDTTEDGKSAGLKDTNSGSIVSQESDLAQELVRILGDTPVGTHANAEFGRENEFARLPKKPVSASHIKAIEAIVKKRPT